MWRSPCAARERYRMKRVNGLNVACALAVFALGVSTTMAATGLPYADGFEGGWDADSDLDWSKLGTGKVDDDVAAVLTGAGSMGLLVSNDTATLDVDDATYTYDNVWIQIYAKPVPGDDDPPEPSGVSGAFYVKSDSTLHVFDGVWSEVPSVTIPTDQYVGFIVHADYGNGTWDIYQNDGTYKAVMTKIAGPIDMDGSATEIDSVSIESGDAAYIDAVAVAQGGTAVDGSSPDKVRVAEFADANQAIREFSLPVYAAAYGASADARSLSGTSRLAADLGSGLVVGDALSVYTDDEGAFEVYEVDASGNWALAAGGGLTAAADVEIFTATRLLMNQKNSPRGDTFGFFPYDSTTVVAIEGQKQPTASGFSESIYLNGTGDNGTGFTALEWVASMNIQNLPWNSNSYLQDRDRMWVKDPVDNQYDEYWWQASSQTWQCWGSTANASVPGEARIWILRQAAAGTPVPISY